jgi:heme A synthase
VKTVRRFAYAAFVVACLHLVFGAIVRITGSGMGCGPHWPKCYGYWFPPMSRPDLVIEVMHRYLASILLLSLVALVVAALRRRSEPGVGGPGGVLRPAVLALSLGVGAALLGALTVKFGNAPLATLAHWTVAMSLVAAVTAAVIRAGGLGGAVARAGGASARARRGSFAAAGLALTAVVMGGLTAKYPGAPVACQSFLPFCNPNPDVVAAAVHVQVTHRWIAVLLVGHLVGLFFGFRKRGEAPIVRRAATIALSLGVLQLLVAGAMIGMHLPPVLRSLHEATGVSIWIATFALAYLTRIASEGAPERVAGAAPLAPVAGDVLDAGSVRAMSSRDGAVTAVESKIASGPVAVLDPAVVAERVAVLATAAGEQTVASMLQRAAEAEPFESPASQKRGREVSAAGLALAQVAAEATLQAARTELEAAMAPAEGEPIEAEVATVAAEAVTVEAEAATVETVETEAMQGVPELVATEPEVVAGHADAVRMDADAAGIEVDAAEIAPEAAGIASEAAPIAPEESEESPVAGGPPSEKATPDSADEPDPIVARRTIFDDADDFAAADLDTDKLGPDPFDDTDDLDDGSADPVLSLDEEFSRLAVDAEDPTDFEPVAVAEHATAATLTAVGGPATAAGAVASSKAVTGVSTMHHSVAVIVSRGADF